MHAKKDKSERLSDGAKEAHATESEPQKKPGKERAPISWGNIQDSFGIALKTQSTKYFEKIEDPQKNWRMILNICPEKH